MNKSEMPGVNNVNNREITRISRMNNDIGNATRSDSGEFNLQEKRISILSNYGENFNDRNYITNPAIGRDEQIKEIILELLTPDKSVV